IHRFDQMLIEPGLFRLAAVAFLAPAGQRDEYEALAPGLLADVATSVITIQLRHADVQEYEVGTEPLRRRDGLQSVVRQFGLMPEDVQEHGQGVRAVLVVIDNQNAPARSRWVDRRRRQPR